MSRVWIIPGMDGTGRLSRPLVAALGEGDAVHYEGGSYDDALASLPAGLRTPAPDDVIVAESFGGPLALTIAAAHPVARVVLVASFVRSPRWLPPARLIGAVHPPPRLAIRAAMLGFDAPTGLVDEVHEAIQSVPGAVIGARTAALGALDATVALAAVRAEVVWLRATADRLVPGSATAVALRARPSLIVHDVDGPHLLAQRWPERVVPFVR